MARFRELVSSEDKEVGPSIFYLRDAGISYVRAITVYIRYETSVVVLETPLFTQIQPMRFDIENL